MAMKFKFNEQATRSVSQLTKKLCLNSYISGSLIIRGNFALSLNFNMWQKLSQQMMKNTSGQTCNVGYIMYFFVFFQSQVGPTDQWLPTISWKLFVKVNKIGLSLPYTYGSSGSIRYGTLFKLLSNKKKICPGTAYYFLNYLIITNESW